MWFLGLAPAQHHPRSGGSPGNAAGRAHPAAGALVGLRRRAHDARGQDDLSALDEALGHLRRRAPVQVASLNWAGGADGPTQRTWTEPVAPPSAPSATKPPPWCPREAPGKARTLQGVCRGRSTTSTGEWAGGARTGACSKVVVAVVGRYDLERSCFSLVGSPLSTLLPAPMPPASSPSAVAQLLQRSLSHLWSSSSSAGPAIATPACAAALRVGGIAGQPQRQGADSSCRGLATSFSALAAGPALAQPEEAESISAIRARIFGEPVRKGERTGRRVLSRKLRGAEMAGWYFMPPREMPGFHNEERV
jgi:hypothetical protein